MVVHICTKFRKNSLDGFKCINFAFLPTELMRKFGMLLNLGKNCMIFLPFIKRTVLRVTLLKYIFVSLSYHRKRTQENFN